MRYPFDEQGHHPTNFIKLHCDDCGRSIGTADKAGIHLPKMSKAPRQAPGQGPNIDLAWDYRDRLLKVGAVRVHRYDGPNGKPTEIRLDCIQPPRRFWLPCHHDGGGVYEYDGSPVPKALANRRKSVRVKPLLTHAVTPPV